MEREVKREKMVSEPWHKPKNKNGSVFPAKRRSVKKMMWDSVVESIGRNKNNSVHPSSSCLHADDE
ncbi:hypothetical protein SESBI_32719 [Sesbania bispinosa]|nr:hypothetical protein SESBI_32719 [Sesbania bispinosa]